MQSRQVCHEVCKHVKSKCTAIQFIAGTQKLNCFVEDRNKLIKDKGLDHAPFLLLI